MKDMNELEAAVLAAVSQLEPDAYGVLVRERVGEMLHAEAPSTGSVHRALTKLARARLLRAQMGEPTAVRGGRAKRLYQVTAAGRAALETERQRAVRRAAALSPRWRPA